MLYWKLVLKFSWNNLQIIFTPAHTPTPGSKMLLIANWLIEASSPETCFIYFLGALELCPFAPLKR